jgi:hypothetical protein
MAIIRVFLNTNHSLDLIYGYFLKGYHGDKILAAVGTW